MEEDVDGVQRGQQGIVMVTHFTHNALVSHLQFTPMLREPAFHVQCVCNAIHTNYSDDGSGS